MKYFMIEVFDYISLLKLAEDIGELGKSLAMPSLPDCNNEMTQSELSFIFLLYLHF